MGFLNRHFDYTLTTAVFRLASRIFQFVLAITVSALYGIRVDAERKAHHSIPSQWLFAEVVAGVSALTCIVYMIPGLKAYLFFLWDLILFLLWVAVYGIFAKLYLHRGLGISQQYEGTNTKIMQHAMWLDLVNMLLWFFTTIGGMVRFAVARRERSLHTGRAFVNV